MVTAGTAFVLIVASAHVLAAIASPAPAGWHVESGMNACLTKPFNKAKISTTVDGFVTVARRAQAS